MQGCREVNPRTGQLFMRTGFENKDFFQKSQLGDYLPVDWFAASSVGAGRPQPWSWEREVRIVLGVCRVAGGADAACVARPGRARLMRSNSGRQVPLNMRRALGGRELPII